MKQNIWKILGLIAIFFIAVLLYFYKLGEIPSGVYVDEASPIYNAYSVLTTGKDEYGFAYPIYFRLMGSYSPSLFIYISSLIIKFFGMKIAFFRAVSGVSVLITALFFYLLIRKMKLFKLEITYFAATLFYVIVPWSVFNARLGYETTLGFAVFTLGAYFLFLAIKNPRNLIFAVTALSLATHVSHNERFLSPLFLLAFAVVFRKDVFKKKNSWTIIAAFIVGLVINIPNILMLDTRAFWIKSSQFNPQGVVMALTTLSPKTLFFENPDIDMQHTLPKLSMFYWPLVFPWFIGLYRTLRKLGDDRYRYLILYIITVLLPAVFSGYFFSSQRSYVAIIPIAAIIGVGMDEILAFLPRFKRLPLLAGVVGYCLILLYSSYFVLFPIERSKGWNYGYDQIAQYISDHPGETILVDDTRNPRTYILLLYYLNYRPSDYQSGVDSYFRNNYYAAPVPAKEYRFSNVEVRQINWETDPKRDLTIIGDDLAVSQSQMKEHKLIKLAEFRNPSRDTIFEVYRTTGNPE